jgi:hypothetical protein
VRLPVVLVLVFSVARVAPAAGPAQDPAREVIVQALAKAGEIPDQARALVALAWPAGKRDEVISARARLELSRFGDHGMNALRHALNTVKIDYTAEVLATILEAQKTSRVEMIQEYRAALLDALWIGSHGAKVLAIQALGVDRTPLAVGPMIDSAIADPSLAAQVVETLGAMRFQQARFYLDTVMMEGPPPLRPLAASSLAQIGGAALMPLKNALKAPGRETRLLAVRALLPAATEYDLGAIYEYIEKHGDDDPELTQALKLSATSIEKAIAARDAKAAADSPKDF